MSHMYEKPEIEEGVEYDIFGYYGSMYQTLANMEASDETREIYEKLEIPDHMLANGFVLTGWRKKEDGQ